MTLKEGFISWLFAVLPVARIARVSTAFLTLILTSRVTDQRRPYPSTTSPAVAMTNYSTPIVAKAPAIQIATGSPDAILAA